MDELPKDLDIEIGNPEQVFWESMKIKQEALDLESKRQLEINKVMIEYAEKRISEEKAKFTEINKEINK